MLRILILFAVVAALAFFAFRLLSRGSALPAAEATAPDFTLPSQDGAVSLHDYRGKWVVLYFYPKDKTPG